MPLTRLDSPSAVTVLSNGNRLPAPVVLNDLPDFSIPEGEAFWEPLEGMRVEVKNAPVSAATNGFGIDIIRNQIKPDHIVLMHIRHESIPYYQNVAEQVKEEFPSVTIFESLMDSKEYFIER